MRSTWRWLVLTTLLGLLGAVLFGKVPQSAPAILASLVRRMEAHPFAGVDSPARGPLPAAVELTVDADHVLHPISPLIYGVAAADGDELAATGASLNRWGGNPSTRYNWTLGSAWNAARDWQFMNYGGAPSAASSSADALVTLDVSRGVQSLITIPAIGWVASNGDTSTRSLNVPEQGGPPLRSGSDAIAGYNPTANRLATSVRSLPRKSAGFGEPFAIGGGPIYQDEWVHHLVDRFGNAASGGVGYFAIDNEPDLWSSTHTDVHPVEPSYDDLLRTFVEYADAIKDVDPTAQVLGPAVSGWTGYFYSARDRGQDNFRTHSDRLAHGDMPFLAWWLDQVRHHDIAAGRRTLDVLDVHFYPQAEGVYSGADDPAVDRLRLRSTRSLWDPEYVDESWINQSVDLIPRMKAWIDQYYPGTRLAINEWNWGADQTLNGALAIADVLGIYGREGVDMAAYWTSPPPHSPGAYAFAMYTNYDGRGHHFGDLAVADASTWPDDAASYASVDSASGDLLILAINKRAESAILATVRTGPTYAARATVFRYDGSGPIQALGEIDGADGQLVLDLPASSITVLRLQRLSST